ncbi:hypothetical protein [Rhodococcus sp. T9N]|nr:hypothetical protein [Rhodococcus sp. T9N]
MIQAESTLTDGEGADTIYIFGHLNGREALARYVDSLLRIGRHQSAEGR